MTAADANVNGVGVMVGQKRVARQFTEPWHRYRVTRYDLERVRMTGVWVALERGTKPRDVGIVCGSKQGMATNIRSAEDCQSDTAFCHEMKIDSAGGHCGKVQVSHSALAWPF